MKRIVIVFIVLIMIVVGVTVSLYIMASSTRGCGINGCYNSCDTDSDCEYYEIIGRCRGKGYYLSDEYSRAVLQNTNNEYPKDSTCTCINKECFTGEIPTEPESGNYAADDGVGDAAAPPDVS